jgi:mannose-6-phosphate isomerase-like protein (cupin superfamily)
VAGFVVSERDVQPETRGDDTAEVRRTIGPEEGCAHLQQHLVRYAPGISQPQLLDGDQAVLYVVSGRGRLHVEGSADELEPELGAYVGPGENFRLENTSSDELVVVAVTARVERSGLPAGKRTVRFADRPSLPAGKDREFRHLVDAEVGCRDITQFIGVIPPGRAPFHAHEYDEVVYVVEGEGVLHLAGRKTPVGPGTCIHFPPHVQHCLENTGRGAMRVLGVFHPAGDPSRAYHEPPNRSPAAESKEVQD